MVLFPEFREATWDGWRAILARVTAAVRELWIIAGRGCGKSRMASLLACSHALRRYARAPGERIYVGVVAPDRRQAKVTLRYVRGLLGLLNRLSPGLIVRETHDSVELSNGVIIEVITASLVAPRGRAYGCFIVEEAAFLGSEESANPDAELLRAIRPALARVPGALLVVVSSPYARRGELWRAWQRWHDKSEQEQADAGVVFVQASTLALNPTFDQRAIETAFEEDPIAAATEYNAAFRSDVESFVSREAVEACVMPDRRELPPMAGPRYVAFVDPSGGSQDSMTLAIAHAEGGRAVLDLLRERRPPFSPEAVVQEFAETLRAYRITTVTGDRYGGEWPRERFRTHGIVYEVADRVKSDLYRELLPLVNSGRVELLDDARLLAQFTGLERRTARSGKDSIDHGPGGHEDLANAAAGALVGAMTTLVVSPAAMEGWLNAMRTLERPRFDETAAPWTGRDR
jgi:hypothetical protein